MSTRSGMTLLELLVGLAVVGAALTAGYGAFTGVADQRARVVVVAQEAGREAAVRHALMEWLRGARLTVQQDGQPFTGLDGRTRSGEPDAELSFLTTAATVPGFGDAIVRLYIDRGDAAAERGLVAEVREWRGTRFERIELAPGATGLEARYLVEYRGRRWVTSWVSMSALPLGVELVVTAPDPESIPRLLRHPVSVAMGSAR